MYICVCMHDCVCMHLCIFVYVCVYMYISMFVYACVYVYGYAYIQVQYPQRQKRVLGALKLQSQESASHCRGCQEPELMSSAAV